MRNADTIPIYEYRCYAIFSISTHLQAAPNRHIFSKADDHHGLLFQGCVAVGLEDQLFVHKEVHLPLPPGDFE